MKTDKRNTGFDKMLKKFKYNMNEYMNDKITNYIKTCQSCQVNKLDKISIDIVEPVFVRELSNIFIINVAKMCQIVFVNTEYLIPF